MWICIFFLSTPSLLCSQRSKVKAFLGLEMGWGLALPSQKYKIRAVILHWGTRPKARTHLDYPLCSPATEVRLEGVKCQAGWVRSLCNTPSNTDVHMQRCQDHQLNWSPAKSRSSPTSLTPTPLCILCFAHTAQPRQQRAVTELRGKNVCRVRFHSEPQITAKLKQSSLPVSTLKAWLKCWLNCTQWKEQLFISEECYTAPTPSVSNGEDASWLPLPLRISHTPSSPHWNVPNHLSKG